MKKKERSERPEARLEEWEEEKQINDGREEENRKKKKSRWHLKRSREYKNRPFIP